MTVLEVRGYLPRPHDTPGPSPSALSHVRRLNVSLRGLPVAATGQESMTDTREQRVQLFRFCLYGFLKNQQYFEPFLILAFRQKGFSFTAIGALIAFRALSVNLLEIPSGAAADVWGRRRSMIASMASYILSFVVFGLARSYWAFFPAMLAFAVGEAFRTGTHKAMIFDWLTHEGRQDEKTRIYGLTRSWSKIGSSLSVIIAAAVVICTRSYQWIFWISIVPYGLNVVNFVLYPQYLDGTPEKKRNPREVWQALRGGLSLCARRDGLRDLILENLCFEGFYSAAKDYLQPLLKAAALTAPVLLAVADETRTALLVAAVYAVLNLLGSLASRHSHRAVHWAGTENRLAGRIWGVAVLTYALVTVGTLAHAGVPAIVGFVVLAVLLNVWKPVFVSRFYERADNDTAATTLSVANQSKTLSVAVLAPLLGLAVDRAAVHSAPMVALWPVAICGIVFSLLGTAVHRHRVRLHSDTN